MNTLPAIGFDWARAQGPPRCEGVIRQRLEDFQVRERPLLDPDGRGQHLWLEIEKRDANTQWVARQLAEKAGAPVRDVGFAGMKDRRAVTTQWFSVAWPESRGEEWRDWQLPGARVIRGGRHGRKLKRGALKGNRFLLVVRELEGDLEDLAGRLKAVAEKGVPNYFGPQRFGHEGRNVQRGLDWLRRGGRLPRHKRGVYLSAVRSYLFNRVLSERVRRGDWDRLLDGDIAALDGSRSAFACGAADEELKRRCSEFDLHPGGPLCGAGGLAAEGEAQAVIEAALASCGEWVEKLEAAGLEGAWRSLRVKPLDWRAEIRENDLSLAFELPPGSYATAVLRELVSLAESTISEPS